MRAGLKSVLVLDAGGVLVTEPVPEMLARMADAAAITREEMSAHYAACQLPLWAGDVTREEFWATLLERAGVPGSPAYWERFFLERLRPLEACRRVASWRSGTLVYILSNHRSDWLRPVLQRAGVLGMIDCLLISEEVGAAKPQPEIYEALLSALPDDAERILFVDDHQPYIEAAGAHGIPGIVAKASSDWIPQVDAWVSGA